MKLIKSVSVSPMEFIEGESIHVKVNLERNEGIKIYTEINEIIGTEAYLQFDGRPGAKYIAVYARDLNGNEDFDVVTVKLNATDDNVKLPIINFNIDSNGVASPIIQTRGEGITIEGFQLNKVVRSVISPRNTAQKSKGVVTNHITTLINHRGKKVKLKKTVTHADQDFILAQKDYTYLPSSSSHKATYIDGKWQAQCLIKNITSEKIIIDNRIFESLSSDGAGNLKTLASDKKYAITILPNEEKTIDCSIDKADIQDNTWGYRFAFSGKTKSGERIKSSDYFEVRPDLNSYLLIEDEYLQNMIDQLTINGELSYDKFEAHLSQFSMHEKAKIQAKLKSSTSFTKKYKSMGGPNYLVAYTEGMDWPYNVPPPEGFIFKTQGFSDVFIPGKIANAKKGDIVLSPMSNYNGFISSVLHAVNLSSAYDHSGIMVGDYSSLRHSTGSTEWLLDKSVGFTSDGSDGMNPDYLKHFWPGPITQNAWEAFTGGDLRRDPEDTKDDIGNVYEYEIKAFSANGIVPAIVVKPDPNVELNNPMIRDVLHKVADESQKINGHYRFYCYTDAKITLSNEKNAPVRPNWWGSGTTPTVCTTLIWAAMKNVLSPEIHMESWNDMLDNSDLEAKDRALNVDYNGEAEYEIQGATVDSMTMDGLYLYTEKERKKAAYALYNSVYSMVYEKAGWWGRLLTDAPDDTANQLINTFVFDAPDQLDGEDSKDSDKWKHPGEGRAIAPDDILLFWDDQLTTNGNKIKGLYGTSEPVQLIAPRFDRIPVGILEKKPIENGFATFSITLLQQRQSKFGIEVVDLGRTFLTENEQLFKIELPTGILNVRAFIDMTDSEGKQDRFYSPMKKIEVTAGLNKDVRLVMDYPVELSVLGDLFIYDYDPDIWPFTDPDDTETFYIDKKINFNLLNRRYANRIGTYKCGGEMLVDIDIDAELYSTYIQIKWQVNFYEGAGEDRSEIAQRKTHKIKVPLAHYGNETIALHLWNEEDDQPKDYMDLNLSMNARRTDTEIL